MKTRLKPLALAALAMPMLPAHAAPLPDELTHQVYGRVTDTEGRPVAGAEVYGNSFGSQRVRSGRSLHCRRDGTPTSERTQFWPGPASDAPLAVELVGVAEPPLQGPALDRR
jgi:hypothetical protein